MLDPCLEDIETFCCQTRRQVIVSLQVTEPQQPGFVVTGSPFSCNYEASCSRGIFCLLKAKMVTTGRRRQS